MSEVGEQSSDVRSRRTETRRFSDPRCLISDRCLLVIVFLLVSIVYLTSINRPLRDAESKYAEIPREMLVTGDWLTPQLDFARYFTKPPLTFWVTALAYKVLGVHPWVARLTNILWAFLAAFLLGVLTSRLYGKEAGRIATVLFVLTAEVFTYCLDAGIEFGLISCIIGSLTSFWIYVSEGDRLYLRLFYLGVGLSYLAKGILGIALPATIAGIFVIATGRTRRIWEFFDWTGLILLALCVLPWTIAMAVRYPDFLKDFVINEHFGAFLGRRDSNDAIFPTGLFLALGAGEFFPWILYMPVIIKSAVFSFRRGEEEKEKLVFLISWFFVPFIVFSVSRSKVDFYIMHLYIPLIVVLAREFKDVLYMKDKRLGGLWSYPWLVVGLLAVVSLVVLKVYENGQFVRNLDIPSLTIAYRFLVSAAIFGFLIFFFWTRGQARRAFIAIAVFMVLFFHFTEQMFVTVYPSESMKFAASTYNEVATERDVLFTDERPEFAHVAILPFYTGKVAYLLRNRKNSKLHFILKDRMALCFDEDQFKKIVAEKGRVFLVGKSEKTISRLKNMRLKFRIVKKSDGRALFVVF